MALLLETKAKEILISPLDWPRCAKCEMPVEKFSVIDTENAMAFVAACHGQEQIVNVPDELWADMLGSHVNFGPAFSEDNT